MLQAQRAPKRAGKSGLPHFFLYQNFKQTKFSSSFFPVVIGMISVLAQERLLGAALGSVFTGIVVFEQRKSIYRSMSDTQPQLPSQFQMKQPFFGKKSRAELARFWNKAIDQSFGPVIHFLSSRGW